MLMEQPTVVVGLVALGVIVLWLDVLLAGGAMTGGMMHVVARMLSSPYGWLLSVTLVIVILVVFGLIVEQP